VTFVATDNYGAGVIAARQAGGAGEWQGKVAELMHKPGGMSTGDRERAFEATMAKEFFRRSRLWIAAMAWRIGPNRVTRPRTFLTAHPDLDGLFASAEANSLGAMQAIKSARHVRQDKAVTFDFSDEHVAALKDGTIMSCWCRIRIVSGTRPSAAW